jgi:hypothetical protein
MPKSKSGNRDSNKKGYYILDTHKIKKCKGLDSYKIFSHKIGVHENSVKRYIDTKRSPYVLVQESKAKSISLGVGKPISELVYRRELPKTKEFYTSITRGWFVDNVQGSVVEEPRKPRWFSEEVKLEYDPVASGKCGHLSFVGEIQNCCGEIYKIRAERLSDCLFCMLSDGEIEIRSFVGIAQIYIRYDERDLNVIIGTWSGIDTAGYASVFRWVLTNRAITKADIQNLSRDFHIEPYLKTSEFHYDFDRYSSD